MEIGALSDPVLSGRIHVREVPMEWASIGGTGIDLGLLGCQTFKAHSGLELGLLIGIDLCISFEYLSIVSYLREVGRSTWRMGLVFREDYRC